MTQPSQAGRFWCVTCFHIHEHADHCGVGHCGCNADPVSANPSQAGREPAMNLRVIARCACGSDVYEGIAHECPRFVATNAPAEPLEAEGLDFEAWFTKWCVTDEADFLDAMSIPDRAQLVGGLKGAWQAALARRARQVPPMCACGDHTPLCPKCGKCLLVCCECDDASQAGEQPTRYPGEDYFREHNPNIRRAEENWERKQAGEQPTLDGEQLKAIAMRTATVADGLYPEFDWNAFAAELRASCGEQPNDLGAVEPTAEERGARGSKRIWSKLSSRQAGEPPVPEFILKCGRCGHVAQEGESVGIVGCSKCNPEKFYLSAGEQPTLDNWVAEFSVTDESNVLDDFTLDDQAKIWGLMRIAWDTAVKRASRGAEGERLREAILAIKAELDFWANADCEYGSGKLEKLIDEAAALAAPATPAPNECPGSTPGTSNGEAHGEPRVGNQSHPSLSSDERKDKP